MIGVVSENPRRWQRIDLPLSENWVATGIVVFPKILTCSTSTSKDCTFSSSFRFMHERNPETVTIRMSDLQLRHHRPSRGWLDDTVEGKWWFLEARFQVLVIVFVCMSTYIALGWGQMWGGEKLYWNGWQWGSQMHGQWNDCGHVRSVQE